MSPKKTVKRDPKLEDAFYAAKVPALARARCTEQLTYAGQKADLVEAHLAPNYQYFGALDKTLAGFYILDSTGDDYTLLDLRARDGHVYFQDHDAEIRNVEVRYASLADYAKGTPTRKRTPWRTARPPTTERLWRRYLWISILFDRSTRDGATDDATDAAIEAFQSRCNKDITKWHEAFDRDRKLLAKDPHVAVYWLLHFTCTCEDDRRAQVVEAVRGTKVPLVAAFVKQFGAMTATGTLKLVPDFRQRRSRFAFAIATACSKAPFEQLLRAFEVDRTDRALWKAVALVEHAGRDEDRARLAALVGAGTDPGTLLLRAKLAGDRAAATAIAKLVPRAAKDELPLYGRALVQIATLVQPKALAAAQRALLAVDPYNRSYLSLGSDGAAAGKLDELASADQLVVELREGKRQDALRSLARPLKDEVCLAIVNAPAAYPLEVLAEATLHTYQYGARTHLIDKAIAHFTKLGKAGNREALDLVWSSFLLVRDDIVDRYDGAGYLRRVVLRILRPHLHTRELFPRLVDALGGSGTLPEQLLMEELSEKKLLARFDRAQVATLLPRLRSMENPSEAVRNWAPRVAQLLESRA